MLVPARLDSVISKEGEVHPVVFFWGGEGGGVCECVCACVRAFVYLIV